MSGWIASKNMAFQNPKCHESPKAPGDKHKTNNFPAILQIAGKLFYPKNWNEIETYFDCKKTPDRL